MVDNIICVELFFGEGGVRQNIDHDSQAPRRVIMAGVNFIRMGRLGCGSGGRSQFIIAPAEIAARDSVNIGYVRFISSLWVLWRGQNEGGDHSRKMVSRRE